MQPCVCASDEGRCTHAHTYTHNAHMHTATHAPECQVEHTATHAHSHSHSRTATHAHSHSRTQPQPLTHTATHAPECQVEHTRLRVRMDTAASATSAGNGRGARGLQCVPTLTTSRGNAKFVLLKVACSGIQFQLEREALYVACAKHGRVNAVHKTCHGSACSNPCLGTY